MQDASSIDVSQAPMASCRMVLLSLATLLTEGAR
jgi:hypothetical protein